MWNYRVVKEEEVYTIREVFYHEDKRPHSWTVDACYPAGDDLDELIGDIQHMQEAFERPILHVNGDELIEEI